MRSANIGSMNIRRCWVLLLLVMVTVGSAGGDEAPQCVVFLHGLARTSASMQDLADAFDEQGYIAVNVDYPSRKHTVEELAPLAIDAGVARCAANTTVHFVTHSMGGILIRHYLENETLANLGRVVMLAPPNQGSEIVDALRDTPGFKLLNGPAGLQLGTGADGIVQSLGPVTYEVGIIAGTRTLNPLLSRYLPNPDDGKVSLESTKVEGMSDFVAVPHSHPFIMQAPRVIEFALAFVETGRFVPAASEEIQ